MTQAVSVRNLTPAQLAAYVREGTTFESGRLYGEAGLFGDEIGELPKGLAESYLQSGARYTIWSYDTPIGWIDRKGSWVIPQVNLGSITAKHQALVSAAAGKRS